VRLYLDACAIIYSIEGIPQFRNAVLLRIASADATPGSVLMTSQLSRLECRVKPLRDKQAGLLGQYETFFTRQSFLMCPITAEILDRAAALRATHGFKTPDAIHLSTAMEYQADLFLTGDAELTRCPGLHVEVI
jgi:uncharacterized protein